MQPTPQDDSVIEAARKTALALDLPWSEVQPIYRALQAEDGAGGSWLPKSVGRTIFTAHPGYIARLLIALGFRAGGLAPSEANCLARGLTLEGRPMSITDWPAAGVVGPVEAILSRLLTTPEASETVEAVCFDAAAKTITIRHTDGHKLHLSPTDEGMWSPGWDMHRDAILAVLAQDTARPLSGIGVIDGSVFSKVARTVAWRTGPSPVRHGDDNDE